MTALPASYIQTDNQGRATTFVGPAATDLVSIIVLKAALNLFAKTGIRPNRHISLSSMLRQAATSTGEKYANSRASAARAAKDLENVIAKAKAEIPVIQKEKS